MDTNLPAETGQTQENSPSLEMCENGTTALSQAQLFEEYSPRVFRIAWRLLGNEADAQDVTQDVFLQVMRNLAGFRGEAALATWLHRVAVNTALAFRRKRAARDDRCVHPQREDFLSDGSRLARAPHPFSEPQQQALDHERHQVIEEAIRKLPEKYRDVYVLADLEELPNTEISHMLGVGVAAVKSRLHRARSLMKRALAGYVDSV